MNIELTERQALLCERALEMLACGGWPEFEKDIEDFSGQALTEDEVERLKKTLRGD